MKTPKNILRTTNFFIIWIYFFTMLSLLLMSDCSNTSRVSNNNRELKYLGTFVIDVSPASKTMQISLIKPVNLSKEAKTMLKPYDLKDVTNEINAENYGPVTLNNGVVTGKVRIQNLSGMDWTGVNFTITAIDDSSVSVANPSNGNSPGWQPTSWFWTFYDIEAGAWSTPTTFSFNVPNMNNFKAYAAVFANEPEVTDTTFDCATGDVVIKGHNFGDDPGSGNRATVTHNITVNGNVIMDQEVTSWSDTRVTAHLGGGVTIGFIAVTKSLQPSNRKEDMISACPSLIVNNYGSNTVSVFNTYTLQQIPGSPFSTSNGPGLIDLDPYTDRVYVGDVLNDSLDVYTLLTVNDSTTMSPIAGSPFLLNSTPNSPQFYYPTGIVVDKSTSRVYVADWTNNTVVVFDEKTMTQIQGSPLQVGTHPVGVALDPNMHLLFVSNFDSNSISVFDTQTMTQIPGSPFPTSKHGPIGIAVDTNTQRVYVAEAGENWYSDCPLISFWGYRIYACKTDRPVGGLDVFDYSSGTPVLVSGSPFATGIATADVAIDPYNHRAFVTNYGQIQAYNLCFFGGTYCYVFYEERYVPLAACSSYNMTVYDTTTMTQVPGSPYSTGCAPLGIAFNPLEQRVYTTNFNSGTITAYDTTNLPFNQIAGSPFTTGGTYPGGIAVYPNTLP